MSKRLNGRSVKYYRQQLIERDSDDGIIYCCLCSKPIDGKPTIEHHIDRAESPELTSDMNNMGLAHSSCNYRKSKGKK